MNKIFVTEDADPCDESWIEAVHQFLDSEAAKKLEEYNFDFTKSAPIPTGRFNWRVLEGDRRKVHFSLNSEPMHN